MAKKLRLTDKLLLGMVFIEDVLDSTVGAGTRAYHSRKLGLWTPPNYKGSAFRQNVYRMLETGLMEKKIVKGEPVLVLAADGRRRLARKFSYFRMQNRKWDGYWRLVIFDISEKSRQQRDRLRYKLKELGYGMWQKSIYISPFDLAEDMAEFLEKNGFDGKAYTLTAKHKLMGEAKALAAKVWPLERLNYQYSRLLEKLFSGKKALTGLCDEYADLLITDPCLPEELLPNDWLSGQVRRKLAERIRKQA